ncbi:membrane protein [Polymorphobacter glacialis]|uniref:Membrane protein n=1 Tax=Sandarakinorhabdus glacialis TaxID=1614636 RepID=A0A916ZM85_9SPHN|nr:DUF4175 domain-containing protein [Polymorphobacter glacialis]GGE03072.1 membrane protein [Polymorphobacter glacialis]
MTADAFTAAWSRPARARSTADTFAIGAPLALAAAALAWRAQGPIAAAFTLAATLALTAAIAAQRARKFNSRWLTRELDSTRPEMEDSADLFLADPATLNPLQTLQRARLQSRLQTETATQLRPAWTTHAIIAAWLTGLALTAAALFWPGPDGTAPFAPTPAATTPSGPPRLISQTLRITPPAYTGLQTRTVTTSPSPLRGGRLGASRAGWGTPQNPNESQPLTASAPINSRLTWTLTFAPQPTAASLTLLTGQTIPLTRTGTTWTATRTLDRSMLYRITHTAPAFRAASATQTPPTTREPTVSPPLAVTPAKAGAHLPISQTTTPLNRINAIPDSPPIIRVLTPERTLTEMTPSQPRWPLTFEATDDHAITPTARLRIIVTSGEGENITFRESTAALTGAGPPKKRRFTANLPIAALGLTPGNDIVAQLIVTDNRAPNPQTVRSPSLILRWPPNLGQQAGGLEGMVKTVLPAYFRSQRQIIIDAEALLRDKRRITPERFAARSDALGEDQRILRMRYGQFLGEESSEAPSLPVNDSLPTNDAPQPADKPAEKTEAPALPAGHAADDGHGHAAPEKGFGKAIDVLAEYGHEHGDESATIADPVTRETLRQALDAMWDSERNLRQAAPEIALPFAYTALELIKKVQQASRIYLSRTGPELPPIDPTRRLTGDRRNLGQPSLAPPRREAGDPGAVPAAAWRALAGAGAGEADLESLQAWVANNPVADPLAFAAAIDAVQRDRGCQPCRRQLRGLLWAAMKTPPAQIPRRPAADETGRRYLDALR